LFRAVAAGWAWAHEQVVQPHLLPMLQAESKASDAGDSAQAAAVRVLGPLLLLGVMEGGDAPGLQEARQALTHALQSRSGTLCGTSCAAAEATLELIGRAEDERMPERAAVTAWWRSLAGKQQADAPERLARALRTVGLLPPCTGS
jgi:hypothetical protein